MNYNGKYYKPTIVRAMNDYTCAVSTYLIKKGDYYLNLAVEDESSSRPAAQLGYVPTKTVRVAKEIFGRFSMEAILDRTGLFHTETDRLLRELRAENRQLREAITELFVSQTPPQEKETPKLLNTFEIIQPIPTENIYIMLGKAEARKTFFATQIANALVVDFTATEVGGKISRPLRDYLQYPSKYSMVLYICNDIEVAERIAGIVKYFFYNIRRGL